MRVWAVGARGWGWAGGETRRRRHGALAALSPPDAPPVPMAAHPKWITTETPPPSPPGRAPGRCGAPAGPGRWGGGRVCQARRFSFFCSLAHLHVPPPRVQVDGHARRHRSRDLGRRLGLVGVVLGGHGWGGRLARTGAPGGRAARRLGGFGRRFRRLVRGLALGRRGGEWERVWVGGWVCRRGRPAGGERERESARGAGLLSLSFERCELFSTLQCALVRSL